MNQNHLKLRTVSIFAILSFILTIFFQNCSAPNNTPEIIQADIPHSGTSLRQSELSDFLASDNISYENLAKCKGTFYNPKEGNIEKIFSCTCRWEAKVLGVEKVSEKNYSVHIEITNSSNTANISSAQVGVLVTPATPISEDCLMLEKKTYNILVEKGDDCCVNIISPFQRKYCKDRESNQCQKELSGDNQNGGKVDESFKSSSRKIDILIVNDNSPGMSEEHFKLAPSFRQLIADLDSAGFDYRIGMTTTDITENRAGKLIPFAKDTIYLTPSVSDRESLIVNSIKRPETLVCEKFIADWIRTHNGDVNSISKYEYAEEFHKNCPSGDERGVYSANVTIKDYAASFIRPDAHFTVVYVSDEDVRSGLYASPGVMLETLDQPSTTINLAKTAFSEDKFNSVRIHSIVVKDNACNQIQSSQFVDGYKPTAGLFNSSIGSVYLTFAYQGWGIASSICDTEYFNTLEPIFADIKKNTNSILLRCKNPIGLNVKVGDSPVDFEVVASELKIKTPLDKDTLVNITYSCSN